MIISFFEEFPTTENLKKVEFVTWPTKIYIAAPSLTAFKTICTKIKSKNVKEHVYWPTLKRNEGYWISPFSKKCALTRILDEVGTDGS